MNDKIFSELMLAQERLPAKLVNECNGYTERFGLKMTEADALMLVRDRKEILKREERFEFGDSILPGLIFAFCDSPYIYQDNYVETIGGLQEIFYYYKNESLDEITDDELIEYMREQFDGECQGSLEFLEETCLETFCRGIRASSRQFMGGAG